jgi:hypothetical protein
MVLYLKYNLTVYSDFMHVVHFYENGDETQGL